MYYKVKKTKKREERQKEKRHKPSTGDFMVSQEMICLAQAGDAQAVEFILRQYKDFVRIKAVPYFLIGGMKEDVVQEGMIGLYKGIRDYDPTKGTSFKSFADLCIRRQIVTAVHASTRKKHGPLNRYVSLSQPLDETDSEKVLVDLITGSTYDPEELLIGKENIRYIKEQIRDLLSSFEIKVLNLYLEGQSYQSMAKSLGKPCKSVDNAIQRIKRKLEKLMDEMNC